MDTLSKNSSLRKRFRRRVKHILNPPTRGRWIIPYQQGIKIQRFWFRQRWVQRLFFHRQLKLLKKMVGLSGNSQADMDDLILCSLMTNTWKKWRKVVLSREENHTWSTVEGLERLLTAKKGNRGIILVTTHSLRTSLLRSVIRSCGLKEIYSIHHEKDITGHSHLMAAYARQLVEAQKVLKQGGILSIAGDGFRGDTGSSQPFYGRMVPFRSGYADLALRTGAVLLPVFEYFTIDGHLKLEIAPPIEPPVGGREIQIEGIKQQYIQALIERWPRLLPSTSWFKLQQIWRMPGIPDQVKTPLESN